MAAEGGNKKKRVDRGMAQRKHLVRDHWERLKEERKYHLAKNHSFTRDKANIKESESV